MESDKLLLPRKRPAPGEMCSWFQTSALPRRNGCWRGTASSLSRPFSRTRTLAVLAPFEALPPRLFVQPTAGPHRWEDAGFAQASLIPWARAPRPPDPGHPRAPSGSVLRPLPIDRRVVTARVCSSTTRISASAAESGKILILFHQ